MSARAGKKASAAKGSPSAKKQSLYIKVLDEAEKLDFEMASGVKGIDDEIALLRVKIKSILGDEPQNIKLLVDVTNALAELFNPTARTRELMRDLPNHPPVK